jgi:hypothetical protein
VSPSAKKKRLGLIMEDNLFFVDTKGNAKNFNKTEPKKRKIEQDNENENSTKKEKLKSRVVIGENSDSSDEEGTKSFTTPDFESRIEFAIHPLLK